MAKIIELITKGSEFPLEYLMALIALAAIEMV